MKIDVPRTSPIFHVIKNYLHVYDLLWNEYSNFLLHQRLVWGLCSLAPWNLLWGQGCCNSHVSMCWRSGLLQFHALLLLLQETAAQAARQECGQSTNGERFLAGGIRWWCVWASESHLLTPVHINPCRSCSSICSREIAAHSHEMACTSFFWLNLQDKTQQHEWLVPASPPAATVVKWMPAGYRMMVLGSCKTNWSEGRKGLGLSYF